METKNNIMENSSQEQLNSKQVQNISTTDMKQEMVRKNNWLTARNSQIKKIWKNTSLKTDVTKKQTRNV